MDRTRDEEGAARGVTGAAVRDADDKGVCDCVSILVGISSWQVLPMDPGGRSRQGALSDVVVRGSCNTAGDPGSMCWVWVFRVIRALVSWSPGC
jgi:hypothetical protein